MGGGKEGGARTPYEAPNTLNSAQSMRIIDAICEGEVVGFANGDAHPFKSILFNDTPVQNPDGSFNFKGVEAHFRRGTADQSYIPGFDFTERTVAVSAKVRKDTPITRTVSDGLIDRLRITVGVERNAAVQDNGDTLAASTALTVSLVGREGTTTKTVVFDEKGSGAYYQDVLFDTLPPVPFNIRVTRLTEDATTDKVQNSTFFASYVEIIDAKLSYPHTALCALKIDSDQFGSQVPRRNYLLKGRLIKVPSNYDPVTRQYAGGLWDGTFKQAWSNNPAWVFYDLLTQPRFSTLARRLNPADIDKWTLYRVAQYCDESVPDGFGGQEPRFVCNAYLADARQAGDLLTDLASVFTGLPVWDGNRFSVVMDKHSDPVALYSNSNVADGLFHYSGVGMKAVHTAVHVQYLDKNDGYRTKTEYVADDEAIKRYGLNIKQITAFGCDSRGQAARVGAWVLQTELRQQNMVSFTVGREGLQHLPYDIVQVMDNQYAGAEFAGRLKTVKGRTVTLDRAVPDSVGARFSFMVSDGGAVRLDGATVASQPAPDTLVLDKDVQAEEGQAWMLAGKVKPRLYRAVGIKENTEDGTYTVTALLHDPRKYDAVDNWASFDREIDTLHTTQPVLLNGNVDTVDGALRLTWDNLSVSGESLSYEIKIYRDDVLYRSEPDADKPDFRLSHLPNGRYRAEIRGRNARGQLSEPLIKAWTIDYTVSGLRTQPQVFAVTLRWNLPQIMVNKLHSEIWYGKSSDIQTASLLAALPAPQNSYTLNGVGLSEQFYFWVRLVDDNGISGEFTPAVPGRADHNPEPVLEQIQGAVTKSALAQDLWNEINDDTALENRLAERVTQAVGSESRARAEAVAAAERRQAEALCGEVRARGDALAAEARARGQLAETVTNLSREQGGTKAGLNRLEQSLADGMHALARKVTELKAGQDGTAAELGRFQTAQAEKDRASAVEIADAKSRLGAAESAIGTLRTTAVTRGQAVSLADERISAKFEIPDTRHDNRPPSWYWANYPKRNLSEFKRATVLGLGDRYCVVDTTVPWDNVSGGAITQTACKDDGSVWRRKSDTTHTYSGGVYTYTRDTWTAWAADETVAGAQEKADAVRRIAEAADRLARRTDADLREFTRTYADDKLASARRETELSAKISGIKGGRNYLEDSSFTRGLFGFAQGRSDGSARVTDGVVTITSPTATWRQWQIHGKAGSRAGNAHSSTVLEELVVGETYTLSFWACAVSGSPRIWTRLRENLTGGQDFVEQLSFDVTPTRQWQRFEKSFTVTSDTARHDFWRVILATSDVGAVAFKQPVLQLGTQAADWQPAPEDTAAGVKTVSDTVAALDGKLRATHTVKAETVAGGRKVFAGLQLAADAATSESAMLVYADKFGIVDPTGETLATPFTVTTQNGRAKIGLKGDMVADGTILGRHIEANADIRSPRILAGTFSGSAFEGGSFTGGSISIGNGSFAVDNNGVMTANQGVFRGRIEAQDGFFKGVVDAERIEGDVLKMYQGTLSSQSSPHAKLKWTFVIPPLKYDAQLVLMPLVLPAVNGNVVAKFWVNHTLQHTREFKPGWHYAQPASDHSDGSYYANPSDVVLSFNHRLLHGTQNKLEIEVVDGSSGVYVLSTVAYRRTNLGRVSYNGERPLEDLNKLLQIPFVWVGRV